jgi:filamentous hemagglutinin family protein
MSYRTLITKKSLNTSIQVLLKKGAYVGLGIGAFTPMLALANPTGGTVVAGTATIKNSNANTTVVKQSTASAIIDWQQFNIGKGQYVQFLQPSSSSIILNRVIGGGGSSIFGTLTGNGQVFLVNTNGVFFGKGSSIDAQGFLASTLDIADSDFLNGHFLFNKTGGDATVVNQGSITAHKGGYVVLAGDYTENDGLISAQSGHIVLASGSKSTLTLNGNSLVSYAVNQATLANLAGANNAGKLNADGGTVIMTADVANLLKATVVNNTGLIEARAISKNGGVIQLLASGGNIQNAGTLDASATHSGIQGGTITLKGDERTTLTSASKIIATGDGANGGHVEVSGNTLSMRGAMNIGKGGNLLLDPNQVEIVTGSANSGVGLGTGTGESAQVGVNFIQTQLNAGANVAISAHDFIDASSHVKTIKAKGTGNLNLHAGSAEAGINLRGVDITIGGNFKADFGYGSFGHITANSIDIVSHNAGGDVILADDVVSKGVVTTNSLKATGGGITINAHLVFASNEGGIGLDAKDVIDVSGSMIADGDVTLIGQQIEVDGSIGIGGALKAVATDGYASFHEVTTGKGVNIAGTGTTPGSIDAGSIHAYAGDITVTEKKGLIHVGNVSADSGAVTLTASGDLTVGNVHATKNVSLAASDFVVNANPFDVSAGGNISLKGAINGGGSIDNDVTIKAGGNITLDHSIAFEPINSQHHNLTIEGNQLAYTGAGTFVVSAGYGTLILDASIGSAKAPVKYDVNLQGSIDRVQRSIFTTGAINVEAFASIGHTPDPSSGAYIGNSSSHAHAVTLSSKKSISIGQSTRVVIGGDGAVTISAGQDLNISASGVTVRGDDARVNNTNAANLTVDNSVTLHAGQDLIIAAFSGGLIIGEASASAQAHSNGGAAIARNDVTLSAGRDIDLVGHNIQIGFGEAFASVESDAKSTVTATAEANVSINAGRNVSITANSGNAADLSGGYAEVFDLTDAVKQSATVTANANLTIKAGNDISVNATTVNINGQSAGYGAQIFASQSDAKANATAHSDVNFTAGHAIVLTAASITVRAGGNVAGASLQESNNTCGGGCNVESFTVRPTKVDALGQNATANLTATANVSFTAGAGGITLVGGASGVHISAGYGLAFAASVDAGSLGGGKAALDAEAKVAFQTTGNLSVTGRSISVHGTDRAAGSLPSFFIGTVSGHSSFNTFGNVLARAHAGAGATANFKADGSLSFKAAGITMTASAGNLDISAGYGAGEFMEIDATGPKAATNVVVASGVNLAATKGITLTATGGQLFLGAGDDGLSHASVSAVGSGAKVAAAADSTLTLTAAGDIALKGKTAEVSGGDDVAEEMALNGSSGGAITITAKGAATLNAGGAFKATASTGALEFSGGDFIGGEDHFNVTQGTVSVLADGGVTVTAKKSITLTATGNLEIEASDEVGEEVTMAVVRGTATETATGAIVMTAGTTLTASGGAGMDISGSEEAGSDTQLTATGAGAKASLIADAHITLTAGGNISLKGHFGNIQGSNDAGEEVELTANSGAAVTETVKGSVTINAGGNFLASMTTGALEISGGDFIGGEAKLSANQGTTTLTADGSVHINAKGTLTLKAVTSLDMEGSEEVGSDASLKAVRGTATESALGNITLSAGGAFLASAGGGLNVSGGEDLVREAHVTAQGAGAKASLSGDSGVSITTGGTLTLKAVTSVDISASEENGYEDVVTASSGGVASLTGRNGVTITAVGNALISAGAAGNLDIQGGESAAHSGSIFATRGTAAENIDASISIKTKGSLTLKAGKGIEISGSEEAGSEASLQAIHGTATLGVLTGVTLTAGGAIAASAGSFMDISAGEDVADDMDLKAAGAGSKITVNADSGITLTAGGAVSLKAHTTLDISGADFIAAGNTIDASSGAVVSVKGRAAVDISANGGAFLASAQTSGLDIEAGDEPGEDNTVTANHATVGIAGDTGVHIKAKTTLTLNAGGNLQISGSGDAASDEHFTAIRSTITDTGLANVTLLAGGNVGMTAGSHIEMSAGGGAAEDNNLTAKGSGSKITVLGDGGVTVSGHDIVLKSGKFMDLSGSESAAHDVHVHASSGAVIGVTGLDNLTIVAKGKFSASAATAMTVHGGEDVGDEGSIHAVGAATKATVTGEGTVSITAAGTVTLKGHSVRINASVDAASEASLEAGSGAAASLTADAGVTINAGGNFLVSADSGALQISGGHFTGGEASLSAKHGTATLTADTGVHISVHGNTTLKATAGLSLKGGSEAGSSGFIFASNGKATETVSNGLTFATTGVFTASAGAALAISAGSSVGRNAATSAESHGTAIFNASGALSIKAGTTLNLTAGAGTIKLDAGVAAASHARVDGSKGIASMTLDAGLSLAAGGNMNITLAGHDLDIRGAGGGAHAGVTGDGAGGKANLTVDGTVSLTAAGAIKETGADNLVISAGVFPLASIEAGVGVGSGGKAGATIDSGITIKGHSLNFAHSGVLTLNSIAGVNGGGLVEKGKVTISGGHITGLFPLGGGSLGSVAFGALGSIGGFGSAGATLTIGGGVDLGATQTRLTGGAIGSGAAVIVTAGEPTPLPTITGGGIVVHLQPVLSPSTPRLTKAFTDFTPSHASADYAGGGCVVTMVRDNSESCRIR